MNKSIKYLIKRQRSNDVKGFIKVFDFKKARAFNFFKALNEFTEIKTSPNDNGELSIKSGAIIRGKNVEFDIVIKKIEGNDFNFFASDGNYSDGTLLFLWESVYNVIERVITGCTFPLNQYTLDQVLDALESGEYTVLYDVGDIIYDMQPVDKSPDEEKPWCKELSGAFLPIKYSLIKKETKQ